MAWGVSPFFSRPDGHSLGKFAIPIQSLILNNSYTSVYDPSVQRPPALAPVAAPAHAPMGAACAPRPAPPPGPRGGSDEHQPAGGHQAVAATRRDFRRAALYARCPRDDAAA